MLYIVILLQGQSIPQQKLGISSANVGQLRCQFPVRHHSICANKEEMEEQSDEEF